jgi:hypothetical protein
MTVITGLGGKVKVDTVPIAEVNSWEMTQTVETKDFHTMGDAYMRSIATIKSASGSIEVFYDPADDGQNALALGASVALSLYPAGDATGKIYIDVDAIITEIGSPVAKGDEIVTNFSWKATGAWTEETVA